MLQYLNKEYKFSPVGTDPRYQDTYTQIKNLLLSCQGRGDSATKSTYPDIESRTITTKIVKLESFRECTVVYCLQHDTDTNDDRYLVYGMNRDNHNYGSSGDLSADGIVTRAECYCPRNI